MQAKLILFGLFIVLSLLAGVADAERIKDLADIQGVRSNQLIGYGLVVGLDGSGDMTTQTPFTVQSVSTMLSRLGINLPPGTNLQLRNVAAVMVTAQLPAFSRPGQPIDVTVSSMGNAKSLRGGTLLLTPLKGADGNIYAMAQGSVAVGGAGASAGGSSRQINHLSAGRIPGGATVERAVPSAIGRGGFVNIELHATDFGTAERVVNAINRHFSDPVAAAVDGRVIRVDTPHNANQRVAFLAQIENLTVDTGIPAARVVINSRTGSVVMNQAVTLAACAVAHGDLSVTVSSEPVISQPAPFSRGGRTVVRNRAQIDLKQEGRGIKSVSAGTRLSDVVKALNALGATPLDLIAILQAMKAAGALHAELEII